MLSSESPAGSEPCGFRVGAHRDVDARRVGRQSSGIGQCFIGNLQHRELLAERRLQIVRGELLRGELKFDVRQPPGTVGVEA